jgi:acetoin utilization protein AcuB
MLTLCVHEFMTSSPYTIGHDQTLTTAHRMMRKHNIRHLPVLEGGCLVGVLSQRDVYCVEGLSGADRDQVAVSEAMSTEVFTVRPEASVGATVSYMATRKLGSAVVVDGSAVVGVFTVTDALHLLAGVLEPSPQIALAAGI